MFARFYKSVYTSILIYNNYSQLYMFLRAEPSALTIAARIEYDNPCLIPHRLGEYSLPFH